MTTDDRPTVLVVDDEPAYLDAYVSWLGEAYEVRTASSGSEAFDHMDATVDVVLLDRRMPGLSGEAILERIRARDLDCRVAMVTAVEPAIDIIEMGFDDYLRKPVTEDELRSTVATLCNLATFDAQFRECFALASKKTALETAVDEDELEASEEYRELVRQLDEVETQANDALDTLMADGDIVAAYRTLKSG